MIKLGPMKIGIRKSRPWQHYLRWGQSFTSAWHPPDHLEFWVSAGSGGSMPFVIDTKACNVTAEIAEE